MPSIMRRTVVLTGKQWVGLPALAVLPVLALANVFGPFQRGLVGRMLLVYVFLLASLRVMGKREMSQMTPFDAVLLFLIPQLFRNYLVGNDAALSTALVASATLLLLVFVTSVFAYRFPGQVGRLVRSSPSVLYEDGALRERELDRERVGPEDLEAAARRNGVDGLHEVHRATLEAGGEISVVRRGDASRTSSSGGH
jgi:uncharacterized membrane protein YcaP (DUF421 family)